MPMHLETTCFLQMPIRNGILNKIQQLMYLNSSLCTSQANIKASQQETIFFAPTGFWSAPFV